MIRKTTQQILTNDQIIRFAPAAGATAPIDTVSNIYDFVSTMDAVDLLRDCGWYPIEVRQSGTRKLSRNDGFQKHMIRFSQKDNLDMGEERVDLSLVNAHNGLASFNIIATIFRKVCANGLMTSNEMLNFCHKHIGFDPELFMQSAKKNACSAGDVAKEIEMMKAIPLTNQERILFAKSAHDMVHDEPEKAAVRPEQYLEERRYDDEGKDVFTTYNVIQENVIRGGIETKKNTDGKIKKGKTRAVKSLDRNIKLNKILHRLAMEMAKLKK
jgi:Domain of unknown function (DUF932)